MCARRALLPGSLKIPHCYVRSDPPRCGGGFADIYMGEHQGRKVAVKVLRVYLTDNVDKTIGVGRRPKLMEVYLKGLTTCVEVLQ